ncbi:MAG: AtpZ/AtpI family protein [Cyclobacteriaceae bacterium]|nr:AtpZ/AtpI family protein [Cyclobacteriaceae bacterium]
METDVIVPIMGIMLTIIITLGFFIMIVYLRKFQNIERMSIIEKGLSPEMFKKEAEPTTVRWALLLIGVGIGFLMGYWLDRTFDMEETGYFSMLFIFGGIGLGLAYLHEEKRSKNNKS